MVLGFPPLVAKLHMTHTRLKKKPSSFFTPLSRWAPGSQPSANHASTGRRDLQHPAAGRQRYDGHHGEAGLQGTGPGRWRLWHDWRQCHKWVMGVHVVGLLKRVCVCVYINECLCLHQENICRSLWSTTLWVLKNLRPKSFCRLPSLPRSWRWSGSPRPRIDSTSPLRGASTK